MRVMQAALPLLVAALAVAFTVGFAGACSRGRTQEGATPGGAETDEAALQAHVTLVLAEAPPPGERLTHTQAEWRERLSPEEYRILREAGTERAFTGDLWDHHDVGTYHCAACGAPLFSSAAKFESGTGWPSFTEPIQVGRVSEVRDESHGMVRTEVRCARCDGHLGHVFDDGPPPAGLRYCMNSAALNFRPVTATGAQD
jgi:peptide-methionine (R)-S-oxide reductase